MSYTSDVEKLESLFDYRVNKLRMMMPRVKTRIHLFLPCPRVLSREGASTMIGKGLIAAAFSAGDVANDDQIQRNACFLSPCEPHRLFSSPQTHDDDTVSSLSATGSSTSIPPFASRSRFRA